MSEAEQLAASAEKLHDIEKNLCIMRWAIVADEATALLLTAEEALSPRELAEIKAQLLELWVKYRYNPRRFKEVTGQELWEQLPERQQDK